MLTLSKRLHIGRVGLIMLSCGTGAQVHIYEQTFQGAYATCTVDVGLMSIELTVLMEMTAYPSHSA